MELTDSKVLKTSVPFACIHLVKDLTATSGTARRTPTGKQARVAQTVIMWMKALGRGVCQPITAKRPMYL